MTMRLIPHTAPTASGLSASGHARSIANKVAFGECASNATATLQTRAHELVVTDSIAGKVHALGTWREPSVHAHLETILGALLAPALRSDLEWYQCRGAFFHNDAHYDARLFGIWCIAGPPAELVFPRAAIRLAAGPGSISVFDPFEVHGVLAPNLCAYSADDYSDAEVSVFLGFELDITPAIAAAFGINSGMHGRLISSHTRIAATSGALDSD